MKLQLSLWENSRSFFRESIAKALLAERDPIAWKFAILMLVQAIELVVKERLRREHPLLVLENVDKSRRTVSLDQGVKRLRRIEGVEIGASDAAALDRAKNWRDDIVHAEVDTNTVQLKAAFATLFGFYAAFTKRHLDEEVDSVLSADLLLEALRIKAYARELTGRAEAAMADERIEPEWIWLCRRCGLAAFVVQDDICRCYVCGWEEPIVHCGHCRDPYYVDGTEEFDFGNHKGIEIPIRLCPSCASAVGNSHDDDGSIVPDDG